MIVVPRGEIQHIDSDKVAPPAFPLDFGDQRAILCLHGAGLAACGALHAGRPGGFVAIGIALDIGRGVYVGLDAAAARRFAEELINACNTVADNGALG